MFRDLLGEENCTMLLWSNNFKKEWLERWDLSGSLGWEAKAADFLKGGDGWNGFLYSNGPALGAFGILAIVLLMVGLLPKRKASE